MFSCAWITLQLHHADDRLRLWTKQHESIEPPCIATRLHTGSQYLLVGAVLGIVWVFHLCRINSECPRIFKNYRRSSTSFMLMVYTAGEGYFQQDNSHFHKASFLRLKAWRDFTLLSSLAFPLGQANETVTIKVLIIFNSEQWVCGDTQIMVKRAAHNLGVGLNTARDHQYSTVST